MSSQTYRQRVSLSRRDFLKLAALGASGALLAACGPKGGAEGGGLLATANPSESGTITAWGWPGTFEGMQAMVETYNKTYPNITVDIKNMGYDDVHTNLLNAIVAGSGAPDLCAIDVLRLTEYVDGLVDLSEVAGQYKDQFVEPTFAIGSYKGKFYGLATDSEPMGMFYRKDILDQYGIKEEDIQIWDDVIVAGDKIFEGSSGKTMGYIMESNGTTLLEVLLVEQGFAGYFFNEDDTKVIVDDPKVIEAVTILKRMWEGKSAFKNPGGGYTGDESTAAFKADKLAMQIDGPAWYPLVLTGSLPEQSGKWRFMRAPAVAKGGKRIGYQYPTIWVLTTQSKLKGEAWELERLALLGEGAKALYQTSAVLPAYKPLLDEIRDQPIEYFGGQKINALMDEIAKDCPPIFFGVGFNEARSIVANYLQTVMDGTQTPEQAMKAAAQEIRTKLKKG